MIRLKSPLGEITIRDQRITTKPGNILSLVLAAAKGEPDNYGLPMSADAVIAYKLVETIAAEIVENTEQREEGVVY